MKPIKVISLMTTALLGGTSLAAYPITDDFEMLTINSVGGTFQSVSFDNTYTSAPVVVCVGQNPSSATWSPVVRLDNVSTTGMSIRAQRMDDAYSSSSVYVGTVYCLVAKEGNHPWPRSTDTRNIWFKAGKHTVSKTFGNGAANKWNMSDMQDYSVAVGSELTGTFSDSTPLDDGHTTLGVLAQIMTHNDDLGQVPYVNDCNLAKTSPFTSHLSACIARHVSVIGTTDPAGVSRAPETLGWIIFRSGGGTVTTTKGQFESMAGVTSKTVESVENNPPYTFDTTYALDGAVATQMGNGGEGAYVTLYGTSPLAGNQIDLALDEGVGLTRGHAKRNVGWMGVNRTAVRLEVEKTVDVTETAEASLLTYTITVKNLSDTDITDLTTTDVLTKATGTTDLNSSLNLVESGTTDGVLSVGETWTYTTTHQLVDADLTGGNIVSNKFTVSGSFIVTEIETAETEITVDPAIQVVKSATMSDGTAIPVTGVDLTETIKYTYTIENKGNVPFSNVKIVEDHRGYGDDPAFGSCSIVTDVNSDTVIGTTDFRIQTLGAGDIVNCTATYTVVPDDINKLSQN